MQLSELVQFHRSSAVSYCAIAAISKDAPTVNGAFRAGLAAPFPILSDAELRLTDTLGIRETSDVKHGPLPVPFTFALLPDLEIFRIFNGWYFSGRPTPEELRQTLRAMQARTRADFEFQGE